MGLVTGALPTGKKSRCGAHRRQSCRPCREPMSTGRPRWRFRRAKSMDAVKYTATHMNMKLPPDQLKTRKGRETLLESGQDLHGSMAAVTSSSMCWTPRSCRDARSIRKNTATSWSGWPVSALSSPGCTPGVQDEIIERTEQEFRYVLKINSNRYGVALRHAVPELPGMKTLQDARIYTEQNAMIHGRQL